MKHILLILILFPIISLAQDRKEKRVAETVEKHNAYYTELLKKSININSGTMNFQGVKLVGELFMEEFKKLGMETEWVDGASWNRAGHVIARNIGKKGTPGLLLIGHLDTVFEPDNPFQKYTMVNDSIMNGPGISDMKGGDVVILLALRALYETGELKNMNIEVVLTGDEEKSGSPLELSKKALVDGAQRNQYALGFENADGNPKTIVVARRSSSGWELRVKGNPAHSSQIFTDKVGVGAIYEASRILNSFYLELSKEENLTFNPGFILGGTQITEENDGTGGTAFGKTNVVAEEVVVRGDLRAISKAQIAKAQKIMTDIIRDHYPETSAEIVFSPGGYPPLSPEQGNYDLLEKYSQVSKDLGFGTVVAVNPRNAGAADVSFTSGHVQGAIDGLGLVGGDDDHTVRETGNINTLSMQAKRAAVLMMRLTRQ